MIIRQNNIKKQMKVKIKIMKKKIINKILFYKMMVNNKNLMKKYKIVIKKQIQSFFYKYKTKMIVR